MSDFANARIYHELPVYTQITEALRHDIVKGDLSPHSRLPSEIELMKSLASHGQRFAVRSRVCKMKA